MNGTKRLTALALVLILGLVWFGLANSQENRERRNTDGTTAAGDAQGRGNRSGRWDPQQMNQRRLEWIKTTLQSSDEEWTVLQPRLEKVLTLSRQTGGGRMMMGRSGREGFGGRRSDTRTDTNAARPGNDRTTIQSSPVDKAAGELQQLVSQKDGSSGAIVAKLTALRQEKARAKTELAAAQKSLREVLNARQEAQLVLMGLLE